MKHVEVNEVIELFKQLQSWDKEEFLWEIGVAQNLDIYDMRRILNMV